MTTILWADDEIDLLKPHLIFLESKGYKLYTATNGDDALNIVAQNNIDLVFLDENMPGKSGLETLALLKQSNPNMPVVMITKSEEENIMDEAIGGKIADYLIKPVKPNQILLTIKKHVDNYRLINQKTTSVYQSEFRAISQLFGSARTFPDWVDVYKKLVYWDIELSQTDNDLAEVLKMQKSEANKEFAKFIKLNYTKWLNPTNDNKPLMSHTVMQQRVFPLLNDNKVLLIVIDNLRFDQWQVIMPLLLDYCKLEHEELYCAILPTSTQYARNAFFAGLMPLEIQKLYPNLWVEEEDEDSKNLHEDALLNHQINRLRKGTKYNYEKVSHIKAGNRMHETIMNHLNNDLNVMVINFVDALSHARTETEIIKELAADVQSYRSITKSWFKHSYLPDIIKVCMDNNIKVVITTDHGSTQVNNPIKVVGDRHSSVNLRYKQGRNLNYNPKEVFEARKPSDFHLPAVNLSSSYIFALENDFLVYPNNYNHFVNYYRNTFQHGGVSLEEMLIPLAILGNK